MESLQRRTQWLTQGLILSGVLNVALLIVCVYFAVRDKTIDTTGSLGQASVQEVAVDFSTYSYEELTCELVSGRQSEGALRELVERYQFDVGRALAGQPVTGKLTGEQQAALAEFLAEEEWPLTGRGLFELLVEQGGDADPSLVHAFTDTLEFLAVDALFASVPHEMHELIDIVTSSSWQRLSAFAEEQRRTAVVADGQRRRFLMAYVEEGSAKAAELFIRTDREHIADALSDDQLLKLVRAVQRSTPETGLLMVDLLLGGHDPVVLRAAAVKLYQFAGEELPEPYEHAAVLQRFVPSELLATPATTEDLTYVVQKGDSLWGIARDHQISVGAIREANGLKSDAIRPGQELTIPSRSMGRGLALRSATART